MKFLRFFLLFFSCIPFYSSAQQAYNVGTAIACIEPDQSLISLHLGGYGAPREGRFTLQWKEAGQVPGASSMAGNSDKLYIISNNELLYRSVSGPDSSWKKAGKAMNIHSIAATDEKLYAISNNGEMLVSRTSGRIKWNKAVSAEKSIISIAASGNNLFASNEEGKVLLGYGGNTTIRWSEIESLNDITSLAADSRKLYAMTKDGTLYQYEYSKKESRWLKAAYKNNITIKEDINRIAIAGNTIYGLNRENGLFRGEHRSEGNLSARAMAIKKDKNTVVIVNVDLCGLNDKFTGLLKQQIQEKSNIPPEAVFINSSHTHFAPVSQEWLTWQEANQHPDSIYLYSTVKNGILTAVNNAIEALAPADLYFGRGKTDIGYNRSLRDHPELYDNAVDVIKVDYSGSKDDNYLFIASCHPVFSTAGSLHYTISANYPGVARKLLEERTGTTNSLFLQGTAGDINPVDNGEYISGEKLSNEVISVLGKPMTKIEGAISCYLDTINIPVTPWSREKILAYKEENSGKAGDVYAEKNVKWSNLMLNYLDEGTMPESMPVYINTINIGNWKLVGFSRETTTPYGLGVKNLWPDKLISIAGYTNDVSSYLPTHMHLELKNYEGLDSFFWYGMPDVFPMSVEETILGAIKSLER